MIKTFYAMLAGVTFNDCPAQIKKWGCDDIGVFRLKREPDNPYDPDAIGIWFLNDRLGLLDQMHLLGQTPKPETIPVTPDTGRKYPRPAR